MNEEQRADLAQILETVACDGLKGPRDLDAALDAIDTALFYRRRSDKTEQELFRKAAGILMLFAALAGAAGGTFMCMVLK